MHFLSDVYVKCDACQGKRFNDATLDIKYKGKSISDVLNMTIAESVDHFSEHPKILNQLQLLVDVGLDYLALGQPSTTLSGEKRSGLSWQENYPSWQLAGLVTSSTNPPQGSTLMTFRNCWSFSIDSLTPVIRSS